MGEHAILRVILLNARYVSELAIVPCDARARARRVGEVARRLGARREVDGARVEMLSQIMGKLAREALMSP